MTSATLLSNLSGNKSIPIFACDSALMEKEGDKISHIAFCAAIFLKNTPSLSLAVAYAQAGSFLYKDKNYSAYYAWANLHKDEIQAFISKLPEELVLSSLKALKSSLPEGVGTRAYSRMLNMNKIPSYNPRKGEVSSKAKPLSKVETIKVLKEDVPIKVDPIGPVTSPVKEAVYVASEKPSETKPLITAEKPTPGTPMSLEETFFKSESEKVANRFRSYLREAMNLVIEEETTYFEQRLIASLARASDALIDKFADRAVSGNLRTSTPSVVIVGPKEDQQQILTSEFGDLFKLRFISSQESATLIPSAVKNAVHVIFWTAFCGHDMFDKVKDHPGLIQVPKSAGMSYIKKSLTELALKKVA